MSKKNNFYELKKLKNWKKKKAKKNFREICAKKVHSKMEQQQNGQRQKGPQQNRQRQSGCTKKTCFLRLPPVTISLTTHR